MSDEPKPTAEKEADLLPGKVERDFGSAFETLVRLLAWAFVVFGAIGKAGNLQGGFREDVVPGAAANATEALNGWMPLIFGAVMLAGANANRVARGVLDLRTDLRRKKPRTRA